MAYLIFIFNWAGHSYNMIHLDYDLIAVKYAMFYKQECKMVSINQAGSPKFEAIFSSSE